MTSHIAFEHFDPEIELGNLDDNGNPIRPRKKPGRKPNPPSAAQRKAQNRAAQRAFRERKRHEMREAESLVQKYKNVCDGAIRENKRLKRRLDELQYETNYLKGYTLTLKMACFANKVQIPKFWNTGVTDNIGADELTFSKTKHVPQQLEFFLDKQLNIISLSDQQFSTNDASLPPSSILSNFPSPTTSFSNYSEEDFIMNEDLASIAPQLANHLETPFFQKLLNTDLVGENHLTGYVTESANDQEDIHILDRKTGVIRKTTEFNLNHYQIGSDDRYCMSSNKNNNNDKNNFPPMTPMDAINQMRVLRNLGKETRALFVPTELQTSIRHDTRIDAVPGAALRDHMILYQDFYDANELFSYLAENGVFLGGEIGNPDSWFVPPSFFKRFWFLCPNHKHERTDNTLELMVNLGKSMIQLMTERKKMYIERELYSDHFPEPTVEQVVQEVVDEVFLQRDDQQHLNDIYNTPMDDLFSIDDDEDILSSNLPLEELIAMMGARMPQRFSA